MISHPFFRSQNKFLKAEVFSCRRDGNPRGCSPCSILKSRCQFSIQCFLIKKERESGYTMNHCRYGNGGTGRLLIEHTISPVATNTEIWLWLGAKWFLLKITAPHCTAQFTTKGTIYSKWTVAFWRQSWTQHNTPAWPLASRHLYCHTSWGNAFSSTDYLHTQTAWYLDLQRLSWCKLQIWQSWSLPLALVPQYRLRYKKVWSKGKIQSVQMFKFQTPMLRTPSLVT